MTSKHLLRTTTFSVTCLIIGCSSSSGPEYINPKIAGYYSDFYSKSNSKAGGALDSLDLAEKEDPNNAYTMYLKASYYIDQNELDKGLSTLVKANALSKVLLCVTAEPPEDPIQTLSKIKRLGYGLDKLGKLGDQQAQYYAGIRKAGQKIANATPINSLSILAGVGLVRKGYEGEIAFRKERKDLAAVSSWQAKQKSFDTWEDALKKTMAANNGDATKEIALAVNLTPEEARDFSRGIALKDKAKQEKAEAAAMKIRAAESAAMKAALASMPTQ